MSKNLLTKQEDILKILQDKIIEDGKVDPIIKSWADLILKNVRSFDDYFELLCGFNNSTENNRINLDRLLSSCFDKIPDIKVILLIGWTPGFNDGDPCTHHDDVVIFTSDSVYESGYQLESAFDNLGEDASEEEIFEAINSLGGDFIGLPRSMNFNSIYQKYINESFSASEKDSFIYKALNMLESQNYSSGLYHTNYILNVTRDSDGKIQISQSDYSCGY